jgi:hypothetical protein
MYCSQFVGVLLMQLVLSLHLKYCYGESELLTSYS